MSSQAYDDLQERLVAAGVPSTISRIVRGATLTVTTPVDVLVNSTISALPYEDILITAIPTLEGMEREMVIRALSQRGMKRAGPVLVALFHSPGLRSQVSFLWAVGNALNAIRDPSTFDDIVTLCGDPSLGMARQMLFLMLPAIGTEAAYQSALQAINDATVRGHAMDAIGRFGRPEALPSLQAVTTKPGLYEHKAKATAIRRLERKPTVRKTLSG